MSVAIKDNGELTQRMAVVKRYRELLEQQRGRFRIYLSVLDKQQAAIGTGSADEITAYTELEEQIIEEIFSIQKVIDPLEIMYNAAGPYLPDNDVSALKAALDELKIRAAAISGQNRNLLSVRMTDTNSEIQKLKNNPFISNARFAMRQNAASSLVDIMS